MKKIFTALILLALTATVAWTPFALSGLFDQLTVEAQAKRMRVRGAQPLLRVGVMQHPTVYFVDANDQTAGLEHDLLHAFAVTQRSEVDWIVFRTPAEARAALERGELDIVGVGTSAPAGPSEIATQSKYHQSAWLLLHTPSKFEPKSFAELLPKRVVVSARLLEHPRFAAIMRQWPKIEFVVDQKNDDETLMAAVGEDEVPYAIVEEDTYNAARHFHFDTKRAFIVNPPLQRSWLFNARAVSLRDEADRFLSKLVREGQITAVLDRYFGFPASRKPEEFDIFTERVAGVLPRYRAWFQEAQERYGIEWRLLAAIGYQESHWNADATSETGVRGIMQFTEDTAKRFGVNRLDPESSILGGARYLEELKRNAVPPRVNEPDKTWLALAAYNIGWAHVENARILTQQSKKNPDSWSDVRRHLPLLAKPEVAARFPLGVCRCGMPVEFVEAVRAYYDVLLRLEPRHENKPRLPEKT